MICNIRNKFESIPLTVKVSSTYAICSILQKCLSFITLPLFTRLLTTEEYGQYTVYSSWYGILMIFLTLNLAYGSFSTAMIKFDKYRDKYVSSIQGLCLILSLLFLVIYSPLKMYWNHLFELPTELILLMVSEIFFTTSTNLWMEKNRFEYNYKSVVFVTLLVSVLSPTLAFILVRHMTQKGYARILGYSLINISVGVVIFIYNILKGKVLYDKEYWSYALKFNLPLLVYYLSQVIFNQSDRIMINHYCGTSKAAMYGVAYNLATVLTFVINAVNGSYLPWLYRKIKSNGEYENKKISLYLSLFIGILIIFVIWFAPEIIDIMAGNAYKSALYVVAPVSMSLFLLFYSQLFINIEFYYEEKTLLVYGSVGAAILNIILNAILIPKFGFVAAGYTTLLSYIVFVISNLYTLKIILKKRKVIDRLYDYKRLFLLFILFMLISFLGVFLYPFLLLRLFITLVFLLMILKKRNYLIDVMKNLKSS